MEYPLALEVEGLTLRGIAHKPEIRGKSHFPVVILFHGFTGNKLESNLMFVQFARELNKHGIGAVRFDFSGSGESDGYFADMTFSKEVCEGEHILAFTETLDWVDTNQIMLNGFSMGGAVAALVAGKSPNKIKKLCLWSPAGNMNEKAELYFSQFRQLPNGNVDIGGFELGRGFLEDLKGRNLYEGITSYQNQVIIIHGGDDQVVPPLIGEKYLEAYKENDVKFHVIEGANHTYAAVGWKAELFKRSIDFLAE
ncbi:alpha/beta hydrolase [Bacillus carboniphilus]|uniref:Alpha/beta hydrolase n=1 Tax=Bacillus carboniphilus TaxID=86663 RepID=A0ABP3FX31_9BACI